MKDSTEKFWLGIADGIARFSPVYTGFCLAMIWWGGAHLYNQYVIKPKLAPDAVLCSAAQNTWPLRYSNRGADLICRNSDLNDDGMLESILTFQLNDEKYYRQIRKTEEGLVLGPHALYDKEF